MLGGVKMNFRDKDYFNTPPSTGYETLVYDCMIGDQTCSTMPKGSKLDG